MLGLNVHILTVDDKYSCCKSENFRQAIQMELSQKVKFSINFLLQS